MTILRRNPDLSLVAEIDALKAKLEARLAVFVDQDAANCPGIPKIVLRDLLLKGTGDGAFFAAMRQLLIERGDAEERAA